MTTPLRRTTFTTNRVLEFFSEKELNMQLGHSPDMWPHTPGPPKKDHLGS